MKKTDRIWLLGLGALLLCGTAFSQDPETPEEPSIAGDLEALTAQVADLEEQLQKTKKTLDETVGYLRNQSSAAQDMMDVFQASEDAGFTAGINYTSREILLAGFRKYMQAREKGLPGAAQKKKDDEEQRQVGGRR